MEEKKLTDEEIVKELINESNRGEWCGLNFIDCVEVRVLKNAIELIHRLQAENEKLRNSKVIHETVDYCAEDLKKAQAEIERLTSLYDRKSGFMTSSIGDLPLTIGGLRKAVDEISRLLTVQGELQELNIKYYNDAKDLRRANKELQKQVDELTQRLHMIWALGFDYDGCDKTESLKGLIDELVKITKMDSKEFAEYYGGVEVE